MNSASHLFTVAVLFAIALPNNLYAAVVFTSALFHELNFSIYFFYIFFLEIFVENHQNRVHEQSRGDCVICQVRRKNVESRPYKDTFSSEFHGTSEFVVHALSFT